MKTLFWATAAYVLFCAAAFWNSLMAGTVFVGLGVAGMCCVWFLIRENQKLLSGSKYDHETHGSISRERI